MSTSPASPSPSAPPPGRGLAIADLCIKRPVFALMMNLFLVVLGWFSFKDIGIDQFPNVELPIITVTTRTPMAPGILTSGLISEMP